MGAGLGANALLEAYGNVTERHGFTGFRPRPEIAAFRYNPVIPEFSVVSYVQLTKRPVVGCGYLVGVHACDDLGGAEGEVSVSIVCSGPVVCLHV